MSSVIPEAIPTIIPAKAPPSLPQASEGYQYPSNMEVWYKMDSSSSLVDYSGNGITGTPTGVTLVDGPSDPVLSFPGSACYISLTNLNIASYNQSFEFWINPSAIGNNMLFGAHAGPRSITLKPTEIQMHDENYEGFAYSAPIDTWQHIVVAITGGVTQILYVDGVPHNQSYGGAPSNVPIGGYMAIGSYYFGNTYFFNGKMGCFRAYSRMLSASEVAGLFAHERANYGI